MTADELGGGVHHDIRAVLDGSDQVRRAEGVVDHEGQTVLVGDLRERVDVGNIAVGVAEGFYINRLGVRLDRRLDFIKVVNIYEGGVDAVERKRMRQQVRRAAVDGLLGNDVLPCLGKRLNGVGDRRRAGS